MTGKRDEAIRAALDAGHATLSVSSVAGWRILANHYSLVMQRTDAPNENGRSAGLSLSIELSRLAEIERTHKTSAAKLRAWCEDAMRGDCAECGGDGVAETRCPHKGCKHAHKAECNACEGTGKGVPNTNATVTVSIRGTRVDAARLARMLSLFDGTITYGGVDLLGAPSLVFGDGEAMAVLVCLRSNEKPRAKWTKD